MLVSFDCKVVGLFPTAVLIGHYIHKRRCHVCFFQHYFSPMQLIFLFLRMNISCILLINNDEL